MKVATLQHYTLRSCGSASSVCDAAVVATTPLPSPSTSLLPHNPHPRTVSAGLPEQTLLLDADLSPHQVLFDDFAASAPQKEAPCFSTGIFAF